MTGSKFGPAFWYSSFRREREARLQSRKLLKVKCLYESSGGCLLTTLRA